MQRDDVTPAQKKKMLLSDATLTGIYMTGVYNGKSIIVHMHYIT